MQSTSLRVVSPVRWPEEFAGRAVTVLLRPLQAIMALPSLLFLAALAAMLFRHPDVSFYEVDRVAFGLLVLAVVGKAVVLRQRLCRVERATLPMVALTVLAVASVAGQPFDNQTWSLIAAKFIVPFTLFHLAGMVFTEERFIRQFEIFALLVLAYLSFTAVAFLAGAKQLIFPHFILDASLGYHADRARGPLLQAVANGVSLNLLGLLAWHSFRRRTVRGVKAALLLGSLPVAILATMTGAVWLSFAATMLLLIVRTRSGTLRKACLGLAVVGGGVLRERREPKKILEWGLDSGKYILFLGRFSPEKGCHLLVEAYQQLDTNVRLVLAGASSYCDDYTRELRTHASERIQMLDWVSGETLDELLTNAMLFVLPSDVEGLSLALLDAMGAGLCVLTSDIPENRELVDKAGFTFQNGNSADLADRLRFLIANPAIREAAGRAAKTRIREQYLWPTIAENIERVYFTVTGGGGAETPAKKPNTRVEAATEAAARAKRIAG